MEAKTIGVLFVLLAVSAVAWFAYRRYFGGKPLAELLVRWMHWSAIRATARAHAADAALVEYRQRKEVLTDALIIRFKMPRPGEPTAGAGNETPAAGAECPTTLEAAGARGLLPGEA